MSGRPSPAVTAAARARTMRGVQRNFTSADRFKGGKVAQANRISVKDGLISAGMTPPWWKTAIVEQYAHACRVGDVLAALRALELAGKHLGMFEPEGSVSPDAQALIRAFAEAAVRARQPALADAAPLEVRALDAPALADAGAHEGQAPGAGGVPGTP